MKTLSTSLIHRMSEALILEALPRGRLFIYNEKTKHLDLLLDNLYFPNGLQLTPDKQAIFINENSMARILKFHLKGEKKGKREVFVDLPGFGDTIRLTEHNTLLAPTVAVRCGKMPSLLDLFGKYPLIRTIFGFVIFNFT